MSLISQTEKLHSQPIHIIEIENGVLLKRGCTEVRIGGDGITQIVRIILTATANGGATLEDICSLFVPTHRPVVKQLVEALLQRRLLVLDGTSTPLMGHTESPLDLFYWHFDVQTEQINQRLNAPRLAIRGVNFISCQLARSLNASGIDKFDIVDDPLLRNLHFFDDRGRLNHRIWPDTLPSPQRGEDGIGTQYADCLIVTSDFGRSPVLSEWNQFCIEQGRLFFPVVLHDMIGYIGPMVIPGETPCFDCLRARQNSHLNARDLHSAVESAAFKGQRIIGFHPSMASILAEIATIELVKFYSGVLPRQVGTLIEVNLLAMRLTARKVLKVPRCSACSPLNTRPAVTPNRKMFTRANEADA